MSWIRLNRSLAIAVLTPVALLLAACSGSSAGGNQPAPAAQATQAPAAQVTQAPLAQATSPGETEAIAPVGATATGEISSPAIATSAATAEATLAATLAATVVPATPTTAAPATAAATAAAASANPPATCTPGALTPALTEGPYYKENPPENSTLAGPDAPGTHLTITGYVFDANCQPLAGARVDFWQADAQGQYDNTGYNLRGYQLTDAQGRYSVTTVVPGLYPGRTRHIHVKVTTPGGTTLTTQLFFANEAANSSDSIFAAQNVLEVQQDAGGAETATFNFVVNEK